MMMCECLVPLLFPASRPLNALNTGLRITPTLHLCLVCCLSPPTQTHPPQHNTHLKNTQPHTPTLTPPNTQAGRIFSHLLSVGAEGLHKGGLEIKKVTMHAQFCEDKGPQVKRIAG